MKLHRPLALLPNAGRLAASAFAPWAVRSLIAFLALLVAILAQWPLSPHPLPNAADLWLRDRIVQIFASPTADSRVALVDVDESSLQALGPWPWPRERLADLVELLLQDGARGVALDMVLPEPADGPGDQRLASLARHGPLVLAQAMDYVTRDSPVMVGSPSGGQALTTGQDGFPATGYLANHSGLKGARCTGNIGFVPDPDGVIRSLPPLTRWGDQVYPTLALALLRCVGQLPVALPAQGRDGLWRLPFSRSWDAYTAVRAQDVFRHQVPAGLFQHRFVVVGSSALGLSDRVATPLSASTSGTLVHVAALTALLDSINGSSPAPWPGKWLASGFALLVALLSLIAFPRLSAAVSSALLASLMLAWVLLCAAIIPRDGDFSPFGPLYSGLFLLAIAIPFEWGRAQWESRQLLDMFQHYVAKPVLDELLRNKDLSDPLAPRYLEVTTLIADMEGYATLVEGSSLEEAVSLTRGFLDCLTGPVLDHGGTLDKYTGDGLMAFWGAPLPIADHADKALDAAVGIKQSVARFNQQRQARGLPAVRVRVGIESGLAVVGDLGTPFRSAYTAVGDSVNVASRLQELARELPHDIVIGGTAAQLASRHPLLSLGNPILRGRHQAKGIFTLAQFASGAGSDNAST